MILYALDKEYNTIGDPIDTWTTAMWYRRYNEEGEMTLFLPASFAMAHEDILKQDYYITNPVFPDHYCIIESIETKTELEYGAQMIITGRSLESILRRRIVWTKITAEDESLQDTIKRILDENIIEPENKARKIPNFVFKASADPRITALTVTCNLHGENVYEVIQSWCVNEQIGFRITPFGNGGFQFELYAGIDHSYNQDVLPWVVFSPAYENLAATDNVISSKNLINAIKVYNIRTVHENVEIEEGSEEDPDVGPEPDPDPTSGSGTAETTPTEDGGDDSGGDTEPTYKWVTRDYDVETEVEVYGTQGAVSGLDRREMFMESLTSNKKELTEEEEEKKEDQERRREAGEDIPEDEEIITDEMTEEEYKAVLEEEGRIELSEHEIEQVYTGEVDANKQFILGRDFELGDVVEFINEFKQEGNLRICEIIHSHDSEGDRIKPTFINI